MKRFKAILENPEQKIDMAYVSIPFNVEKEYGTRGQVKVKATFDGHPYRGVMANMGTGCHLILVRKDVREAIGKKAGDRVAVTIEKDEEERIVELSEELKRVLSKNAKAYSIFNTLSYTNRKEYAVWVKSAKRDETKINRLNAVVPKLLAGKRNPSEK